MTDLAERFARTQGWIYLPSSQTWRAPDGPYRNVAIDVSILPIIWADCEAKGWRWNMNDDYSRIWAGDPADFDNDRPDDDDFDSDNPDPVAALCEAYCKAVEQEKAP